MKKITVIFVLFVAAGTLYAESRLVWPPAPDKARLEYVGEIKCSDLSPGGGLFKKLGRLISGRSEKEKLSLPFDLATVDETTYMLCQNIPALIEIDRAKNRFKTYDCKKKPFIYPVSLCDGGDGVIFITDPEGRTVYRFYDKRLEPFIETGLSRPTGVAALSAKKRLFVTDTGEHSLKIFDYEGKLLKTIAFDADSTPQFNFPTFLAAIGNNEILLNDALNYSIKRFDHTGELISEFGDEGDGPGSFSRPKGIAADSDGHIYVVDNLFDNVQIFDANGRILLAVGSAGQSEGRFWSPAGIDIYRDTVYIADTFNNRIQMLRYLGDAP